MKKRNYVWLLTMFFLFVFGFQIITSAYIFKMDYNKHYLFMTENDKIRYDLYYELTPYHLTYDEFNKKYEWLKVYERYNFFLVLAMIVIFFNSPKAKRYFQKNDNK